MDFLKKNCKRIDVESHFSSVGTSRHGHEVWYQKKRSKTLLEISITQHILEVRLSFSRSRTTGECVVMLVWPWPWPHDLDTRPWPRYSEDVNAHQKDISRSRLSEVRGPEPDRHRDTFCCCDLDLDSVTLINELYLDVLEMYLRAKNEISSSKFSRGTARTGQTHRQTTHRQSRPNAITTPHLWVVKRSFIVTWLFHILHCNVILSHAHLSHVTTFVHQILSSLRQGARIINGRIYACTSAWWWPVCVRSMATKQNFADGR